MGDVTRHVVVVVNVFGSGDDDDDDDVDDGAFNCDVDEADEDAADDALLPLSSFSSEVAVDKSDSLKGASIDLALLWLLLESSVPSRSLMLMLFRLFRLFESPPIWFFSLELLKQTGNQMRRNKSQFRKQLY